MKFNGTNWVNVGNAGFSTESPWCVDLVFSPSGEPYVAYVDAGPPYKATVMKFDGTNWVNVGNAQFSAGEVYIISLAFSPSGEPYVAYSYVYAAYSNKATVMKFNGTSWVYIGSEGFSAGPADYPSLAFSPSGQPYVSYVDWANSKKATVMKFDGTNWVNVGSAGFSAGQAELTSLAFSPSGQPYVAYEDWENSKKVTVMYYNAPLGINDPRPSQLSLYPNPVIDKITISTPTTPNKNTFLTIYDINGQALLSRQLTEQQTVVDVSGLVRGVYFVRVNNDKIVQVGKLVKQ